jgi:hypothetical protein
VVVKVLARMLVILSLNTLFVATVVSAGSRPPQDALFQLLDQYRLPKTIHAKTTTVTDYKTIPPGIFHVEGSQEYWANGSKYRILQLMNSVVFPGMSHDLRWDGEHYQWLNVSDSTLIVSTESKQKTPFLAEPIPLLPLEFLNPGGDDLGLKLTLDEVRQDKIRERCGEARFLDPDNSETVLPGGRIGDFDTTYHLEFGDSPSYLPKIIRRFSSAGVELDTDEIRYRQVQCTGGAIYLPCWARMTDRTTDNRIDSVTTCTVTLIETDIDIPPELFTIDFQTARSVINIDRPMLHLSHDVLMSSGQSVAIDNGSQLPNSVSITNLVASTSNTTNGRMTVDADNLSVATTAIKIVVGLGLLVAGAGFAFRKKISGWG